MSRKRILMVIPQLGYGGAEGAFVRLARYLSQEANVTIALMAGDYGGNSYSMAREDLDLPIMMLDGDRPAGRSLFSKAARWWRMVRKLRQLKREFDVAISFLSGANLLNALAGPKHKTIVSERGSKLHHVGISAHKKILWLRLLDPLTYRLASRIVVVSKGYATEVMQIAGRRARHKVVSIEGPIDANRLLHAAALKADPDIAAFCKGPVVVYCGRLDQGKGIDLLVPAFSNVAREIPDSKFLIIGDGPIGGTLREKLAAAGLSVTESGDHSAKVFLAGYRAQPLRHYNLASVYVFPSLHEGLGNALIEAMASGIPILASDCRWGPRSVLAGPGDDADDGTVGLPRRLRYGTLMPVPDTLGRVDIWYEEIVRALVDKVPHMSRSDSAASIARFDVSVTGKEWLSLIRGLKIRGI